MGMNGKQQQKYVWYAGYGSNLYKNRFIDYIKKCRDPVPPKGDIQIRIPYPLYFAKYSEKWRGGVAFIGLRKNKKNATLGRMYLITEQQFKDVFSQENAGNKVNIDFQKVKEKVSLIVLESWYGNVIYLGEQDGLPIFTFTGHRHMASEPPVNPSPDYLEKIILGLKETYKLKDKEILNYLIKKRGVKGNIKKEELTSLIQRIRIARNMSKRRIRKQISTRVTSS